MHAAGLDGPAVVQRLAGCHPARSLHPTCSASGISTVHYSGNAQCSVSSAFLLSSPCQQSSNVGLQVGLACKPPALLAPGFP